MKLGGINKNTKSPVQNFILGTKNSVAVLVSLYTLLYLTNEFDNSINHLDKVIKTNLEYSLPIAEDHSMQIVPVPYKLAQIWDTEKLHSQIPSKKLVSKLKSSFKPVDFMPDSSSQYFQGLNLVQASKQKQYLLYSDELDESYAESLKHFYSDAPNIVGAKKIDLNTLWIRDHMVNTGESCYIPNNRFATKDHQALFVASKFLSPGYLQKIPFSAFEKFESDPFLTAQGSTFKQYKIEELAEQLESLGIKYHLGNTYIENGDYLKRGIIGNDTVIFNALELHARKFFSEEQIKQAMRKIDKQDLDDYIKSIYQNYSKFKFFAQNGEVRNIADEMFKACGNAIFTFSSRDDAASMLAQDEYNEGVEKVRRFMALQLLTKQEIAKDLRVELKDLTFIDKPTEVHTDMLMSEHPSGALYLASPKLMVKLLEFALEFNAENDLKYLNDKQIQEISALKHNAKLIERYFGAAFDQEYEKLIAAGKPVVLVPSLAYSPKLDSFLGSINYANLMNKVDKNGKPSALTMSSGYELIDQIFKAIVTELFSTLPGVQPGVINYDKVSFVSDLSELVKWSSGSMRCASQLVPTQE